MNYYTLYPEENDAQGVAYAPEGIEHTLLYCKGEVHNWEVISFELKDGIYSDYQANNLGWHLCSERMQQVVKECASPLDAVQWMPTQVRDPLSGEDRKYFVLHLTRGDEVLSYSKSEIVGEDHIILPVLNANKVHGRQIFTFNAPNSLVFVSNAVRLKLRSAKLTGLDFLRACLKTHP